MGVYPKHRKPAGLRKCPICGELIEARGMPGHKALVHGVKEKMIIKTRVNDLRTRVIDSSNNSGGDLSNIVNDSSKKDITQVVSSIMGKDLTECKRPDGQHLYTYEDLCILTARLIRQIYSPGSEVALFNKFSEMGIIEDFEHRFKCRFDDTRKANSNGKLSAELGRTFEAHQAFYLKYGSLKYSR